MPSILGFTQPRARRGCTASARFMSVSEPPCDGSLHDLWLRIRAIELHSFSVPY